MRIPYKNIGSELTTEELNGIVSLLRNNKILNEDINIQNGDVSGTYGKYTFNLQSITIVDNGILITNETLTNLGTVKLSNPIFNNATYTLYLTVYSFDDANIMSDETSSEITTTTLEVTLVNGNAVNIPFNTLNYSCIVSFDAKISIKQDKPVIVGKYVTGLTLTSNKTLTHSYDPTILTIKATDLDNIGVSGKTIKLYKDNTLLTTLTTDNNGEATYTYKGDPTGEHTFQAKHYEIESETVTVQYIPLWYDDAVTSPKTVDWYKSTQNYTETIDNTGTLWTNTSATQFVANSTSTANYFLPNDEEWTVEMDIVSYNDVTIRVRESATIHTLLNFANMGLTGDNHLKFTYNGDNTLTYTIDDNDPVTINTVSFTGNIAIGIRLNSASSTLKFKNFTIYNDATPTLELTATEDTISTGDTTTLTMTLLYGTTPLSGETVKLYQDGTLLDTLTTDNNGEATYTYTGTGAGDITFQAEHGNLQSETYNITDCLIYDTTTHSTTGTSTSDKTYSISYDDIGVDLSSDDFILEWDMKTTANGAQFNIGAQSEWSTNPIKGNYRAYIGSTGSGANSYGIRTTSTDGSSTGTFPLNTTNHCKIIKTGHTLSYYIDDTLLGTKTENWFSNYTDYSFYLVQWNTGTTTIQNITLKPQ